MYVFGQFLHWRGIALSGVAMCCLYVLLLSALPESPRWLLARGREAEARAALRQLRTGATDLEHVLRTMKEDEAAELAAAQGGSGTSTLLGSRPTRRALALSVSLMTLQVFPRATPPLLQHTGGSSQQRTAPFLCCARAPRQRCMPV